MTESLLANVQLHLVEKLDDLFAFKRWVGERRDGPLAVDTESSGLSPHRDVLRLVQFGDKQQGWAIPWDLWKGAALEIIREYEGDWVCHNAPFEQRFFQVHGGIQLPWERTHDTMVMAALDDPMRPKGLKPLSDRLVDPTATQGQKALKEGMDAQGWTWGTVPITFAPYWVYAALDTVLTAHVHDKLAPVVMPYASEAYDLEMATQRICVKMSLRGMRVDVPYIEAARERFDRFSQETRAWLKAAHGITSPSSGGQLARRFVQLGCEIVAFTDAGAPKMDKATLTFYEKNAPDPRARELAKYILAVRHAEKMRGSYLDNFLELRDINDIIHANINTLAARTGRMSVTDPALQTLPRDDKVIRGSFIPRDEMAYITCDLDQIEARLGAHFSEDEGLIEAFWNADNGGADFFCGVASGIFGEEITDKKDPRRQTTKNVVYGSLYGAGAAKMAETAGVPFEQMAPVKDAFDGRYPGLKTILQRIADESKLNGDPSFIRSPLGRKLTLEMGREYTQGLNSLIQGHAAEYFKRSMVDMDAAGIGDLMCLPVHDEIIVEAPTDQVDEVLRIVQECMTDRDNYRVPLTAGGTILTERWKKT